MGLNTHKLPSLSDFLDFLGSSWYNLEPSQVPYFPNETLLEHFFCNLGIL